eukprot:9325639-Lingulodinium_polyedra.AAC.1
MSASATTYAERAGGEGAHGGRALDNDNQGRGAPGAGALRLDWRQRPVVSQRVPSYVDRQDG